MDGFIYEFNRCLPKQENNKGGKLGRYLLSTKSRKVGDDHAVRRSMGKWYCLPKGEGQENLDLGVQIFSQVQKGCGNKVIE